jgi:diaminopimelate epimerase
MELQKYHALGNDYFVLDPVAGECPSSAAIAAVCHRNTGLGSDGILYGPLPGEEPGAFGLRILNPDGSEAEKSGNGLRIFARYLYDRGEVGDETFVVETLGGRVEGQVRDPQEAIEIAMGTVTFRSEEIPVAGEPREVLEESIEVGGETLHYSAASIGNPHCVVLRETLDAEEIRRLGPLLEEHGNFPHRTNVQFARVLDRGTLALEIWERGAGYTLASGSSSCAAAAVARRLGYLDDEITVQMPGGTLQLRFGAEDSVRMIGPVRRIGSLVWEGSAEA